MFQPPHRPPGDILHPEREDAEALARIRAEMGEYAFNAQYQQQPIPLQGGMIKAAWVQYYPESPDDIADRAECITQSWDTAIKAGNTHDYSVCTSWAFYEGNHYLLHIWRVRVEFPALRRAVLAQAEAWRPHAILIEDKGSGQSLLQDIRRDTSLPLIPINPTRDKLTRMAAASPMFEAGQIWLPDIRDTRARLVSRASLEPAKAVVHREVSKLHGDSNNFPSYLHELLRFPAVTHDDQVDSTNQYLNWMRNRQQQDGYRLRRV